MFGLIYCVTNSVNGKLYVGQTTLSLALRWRSHLRAAQKGSVCTLHSAIRKYGVAAFVIEQLDSADSLEELNCKEVHYINALQTLAPAGYNLTTGGDHYKFSCETREKISRMKQCMTNETREKISASSRMRVGRKNTAETLRKMSEVQLGHPVSEGTRLKLKKAAAGRVMSAEERLERSGWHHSEETRRQMSESAMNRRVKKYA
jgi:group I intron endonuclease